MNIFNKLSVVVLVVAFTFSLTVPIPAHAAAISPVLGTTANFSVLGASTITNTGSTVISKDLGLNPGTSVTGFTFSVIPGPGIVNGTTHIADGAAIQAQTDATTAYNGLSQSCDFGPVGPTDLAGQTLTPGVHCYSSSVQISSGGVLHLNALGDPNAVWIFRSVSTLTTVSGSSVVFVGGVGSACNVFWQVGSSATLGTTTAFVGTIIAADDITLNTGATVDGKVLARGVSADGAVTLDTNAISGPTCTATSTSASSSSLTNNNTLTVIKQVINNNGGTATNFPLFINGNPVANGQSVSLAPGIYTVTETSLPNYKTTFAGDCNSSGQVNHGGLNTHNDICTIVNSDIALAAVPIPPLINVTKISNPLVLPSGPGPVTYNYAVSNIGIVPMTDVTVTDNKCGPVNYVSGDINLNSKLDVGEIWNYSCTTTLTQTTTNTATATGKANGLTATDIAAATVVVGSPLAPPLINLIKIPTPLFLPAGGGPVKYTYLVSNPGTVPLSGVTLTDDKCPNIIVPSGDINGNGLLDPNETWTYSCQINLKTTTTNTGAAKGSANGLTSTHSSVVTVVVATAVPALPNTGLPPQEKSLPWGTAVPSGFFAISLLIFIIRKKRTV